MFQKNCLLLCVAILTAASCNRTAASQSGGEHVAITAGKDAFDLATQASLKHGRTLVSLAKSATGSIPYAVLVSYSEADDNNPATCHLQILESEAGKVRVVQETDHLLICSTVADANVERKQLSIKADKGRISMYEERDKKNSAFEFVKNNNDWVISKVIFNYPEANANTDDIEVVTEEGAFPGSLSRTRVADFDASSANLIKKIVH